MHKLFRIHPILLVCIHASKRLNSDQFLLIRCDPWKQSLIKMHGKTTYNRLLWLDLSLNFAYNENFSAPNFPLLSFLLLFSVMSHILRSLDTLGEKNAHPITSKANCTWFEHVLYPSMMLKKSTQTIHRCKLVLNSTCLP